MDKVTGLTLIEDAGISSDHVLVISKIDLGMEIFVVSKEREERIAFRNIMNIPMRIKEGDGHPSLNDTVYKGADFRVHAQLYSELQQIVNDPNNNFQHRIQNIHSKLEKLERNIINRTMSTISTEDQKNGKLIERTPEDAKIINDTSAEFFSLIKDICRKAGLASQAYVVPSNFHRRKEKAFSSEQNMLAVTSFAISKALDDLNKRSKSICQRTCILYRIILNAQSRTRGKNERNNHLSKNLNRVSRKMKRLFQQQDLYCNSLTQTINTCIQVQEERDNHIQAIETARNKKVYDDGNKFIDTVITSQGIQEYDTLINDIKNDVTGNNENTDTLAANPRNSISKISLLQLQHNKWIKQIDRLKFSYPMTLPNLRNTHNITKQAKRQIKTIIRTIQYVRQEEWIKSKNHLIRIGKFSSIVNMVNPKSRSGPIAGKLYPTKPSEPPRQAINDHERMEASLLTHNIWIDDPPGLINCHFLEKTVDSVGPQGVSINPDKPFDDGAEWNYLKGLLSQKNLT